MYGLEGQLNELEDAARCIHSGTDETELAHLEDQVATAAAQVHHAELQVGILLFAQSRGVGGVKNEYPTHESHVYLSTPTTSSVFACNRCLQL